MVVSILINFQLIGIIYLGCPISYVWEAVGGVKGALAGAAAGTVAASSVSEF